MIADKKVVVLDVRTPAEFASGHIEGAKNIDIHGKTFQTTLEQLDKDQPYLVHCAVGMRSAKACTVMSHLQFKTVYDLKGGLDAWKKAGNPVVK
jgi:phage shock protein E